MNVIKDDKIPEDTKLTTNKTDGLILAGLAGKGYIEQAEDANLSDEE